MRKLRSILTAALLVASFCAAYAQDVIVKADGSTVLSKVLEINEDNIKYKKFSNPDGPTYTISIKDVMAVNYANGDIDKFEARPAEPEQKDTQPQTVSKNNAALIAAYNNEEVAYNGKHKDKAAKMLYCRMGVTEKSVLEDNSARISLKTAYTSESYTTKEFFDKGEGGSICVCDKCRMGIEVSVRNISSQTIYIDLANTFFVCGGEAMAYYVPTATSTTESSGSGIGVNLEAVAGAIGLGGAVGTLAGGVSIGGSSSHGTTETVYSQRVISIPPQSSKSLDFMPYFHSGYKNEMFETAKTGDGVWSSISEFICSTSKLDLPVGQSRKLTESDSPCMFGVHVSYSTTEDCSQMQSLHADMYVTELVGVKQRRNYNILSDMRDFADNWNDRIYFFARNGK